MHSLLSAYDINERLLAAVHNGKYEQALKCLLEGAKATFVNASCGRTAIGTAALVGDAEILALLIQSCEEPDLDLFKKGTASQSDSCIHTAAAPLNATELEVNTTPDGMDNLEWEDEFNGDCDFDFVTDTMEQEHTSLYYYYAKTFERTGAIINSLPEFCYQSNQSAQQDVHTFDALIMTPLHYAAACGHLDCARILLEHAARVDAVNSDGYTPLHLGTAYKEITRILLKHGANPNLKTFNTGETPLHIAIRNRCASVANILINSGLTNINDIDDIDQTPLMCATALGLHDIADSLVDKGARVNLQDKEGHSALYYSVLQNNVPLTKRLLDLGARRVTSHYLLHHCVRYNMQQMAELLINNGDNLNVRNKEGVTPILLAILGRNSNMLEFLLQVTVTQGKLVDHFENELIIAVQYIDTLYDFMPIARILFAYSDRSQVLSVPALMSSSSSSNSLLTCYTPYCQTPLARAIMLQKFDIAEFLIKEGGVDIAQICRDHVVSKLRSALTPGFAEVAKLLVHAGFKFPYSRLPFPTTWTPERIKFEEDMLQLCDKPLNLQSLSRIAIRYQLTKIYKTSEATRCKYHATKQESSLSRMIKQLEIPRVLQTFLADFDDCPPTVMRKPIANIIQ